MDKFSKVFIDVVNESKTEKLDEAKVNFKKDVDDAAKMLMSASSNFKGGDFLSAVEKLTQTIDKLTKLKSDIVKNLKK